MFGNKNDDKPICPLLKSACIEGKCMWWTHIMGKHPQTGVDIDLHDCSMKWLPVLLLENAKETRQTAGAVESLRNENVTTGQQLTGALLQVANANSQQLLRSDA